VSRGGEAAAAAVWQLTWPGCYKIDSIVGGKQPSLKGRDQSLLDQLLWTQSYDRELQRQRCKNLQL
jgi:hypothetical protein